MGGRGGMGGRGTGGMTRGTAGRGNAADRFQVKVKDLQNQSPIKLLIDKRKDLRLSDDQLAQIKELETKLKDKNAPLFHAVDSLNGAVRTAASNRGTASDDSRSTLRSLMQELMDTVEDIRDNYAASLATALPLLDDDQRKKADELLAKQAEEIEKASGGARGGRRSRRP
jgi:hypothetical protein